MTGVLQVADGGPADARCKHCGVKAVGPCARCHGPVCGDCCVLTEGGAKVWAICLTCDKKGGRSLSAGWRLVIGWVLVPILILGGLVALIAWLE